MLGYQSHVSLCTFLSLVQGSTMKTIILLLSGFALVKVSLLTKRITAAEKWGPYCRRYVTGTVSVKTPSTAIARIHHQILYTQRHWNCASLTVLWVTNKWPLINLSSRSTPVAVNLFYSWATWQLQTVSQYLVRHMRWANFSSIILTLIYMIEKTQEFLGSCSATGGPLFKSKDVCYADSEVIASWKYNIAISPPGFVPE